jgi:hypothetical protein
MFGDPGATLPRPFSIGVKIYRTQAIWRFRQINVFGGYVDLPACV